ncbi:unnamed protein product [Prunus armeniaca]|uniref:Uncharacterized protein n=1 Tax=Prunus armeniaca TaxID=36596 RepID=A0A6J5VDX8_PRUAR|nr:unnamed protein product [Prunus armeniaca]
MSWVHNAVRCNVEELDLYISPGSEIAPNLSRAKVLTLNEETVKALFRRGSMPPPLNNVCSLGLRIGNVVDELVAAMVSLFRGMPNLCNVLIKTKPPLDDPKSNTSGFNMGYWKMQNLAFINQLKDVTIKLSDGSNGVELNLDDNMRRLDESNPCHSSVQGKSRLLTVNVDGSIVGII